MTRLCLPGKDWVGEGVKVDKVCERGKKQKGKRGNEEGGEVWNSGRGDMGSSE